MSDVDANAPVARLTLSVVVPVYNERATILQILRRVVERSEVDQVVVIDDCSADGTHDVLEAEQSRGWATLAAGLRSELPEIVLLRHEVNQGKGAALRTGFAAATGDVLLTQDADLEYDPADYDKLMGPIRDGRADAVYGSRFAGYPRRVLYFWHSLGNKILTLVSNMLTDLNLTDMETGYKAIRRDFVDRMVLRSERFGIEPELTAKLARLHARIYEVPISYSGRSYAEGKKIGWKDAVSAVWTMVRCAVVDDREVDDPLHATLRRMSALDRYNGFLFETIRPMIGQHVLEVGAGTGTMTAFLAFLVLASVMNALLLLFSLVNGFTESGAALLLAGFAVLAVNVLSFGVVYWWIDSGGPTARLTGRTTSPDFLFPQQGMDSMPGWQPALLDYVFTAYTNIIAFSPTDTMPLSHRVKVLFAIQSSTALVTIVVTLSRAINLIPGATPS